MAAQVYIDGTEVTNVCLDGTATRRLNRPAQATMKLPIDEAIGDVGSRMKVVLDGSLFFHGIVLMIEDQAEEDFGYTTYNATDPLELWRWRPCRDFTGPTPGNLITPTFLERLESGPQVIEEIMLASEDPTEVPEEAEGPLFLSFNSGSFATGGVSLSGAPTNWPMSMADLASLLISSGELDIVLTPIDSGGNMAQVDCYNGNYGTDLTGSVSFDYATGNRNVRSIRQVVDMSNVVNKLQYFLGPKETLTRYKANITGDDPCLPGNTYGGGGVGGALLGRPYAASPNTLGIRRGDSQALYGVRFEFQEFDVDVVSKEDPDGAPAIPCGDPVRTLLRKRWQQESWLRAMPRTLVHVTPVRISDNMQLPPGVNPVQIGDFDIGDLVGVSAGAILRGGFSGVGQRVYEYTVGWDTDGVYELSEIQTSADQEGSI